MYNTGMAWRHGSRGRTGPWLSMGHGTMGRLTWIVVRSVGGGMW